MLSHSVKSIRNGAPVNYGTEPVRRLADWLAGQGLTTQTTTAQITTISLSTIPSTLPSAWSTIPLSFKSIRQPLISIIPFPSLFLSISLVLCSGDNIYRLHITGTRKTLFVCRLVGGTNPAHDCLHNIANLLHERAASGVGKTGSRRVLNFRHEELQWQRRRLVAYRHALIAIEG
jgi:hypothetical protein